MSYKIITDNCLNIFQQKKLNQKVNLTFLDPPFNQNKEYNFHNDAMEDSEYWEMMKKVCESTLKITSDGGAIYFMQREKNTEFVLQCLRETGWTFQNLIIWKKKTSAVPSNNKYGKNYQIIVFATKGEKPILFNKLRITPALPSNYKMQRENGIYVTDVWDDLRELTSGYFAGNEAIRKNNGERFHKQQSPISLLLRIILSSTKKGDWVFDPYAGTGTTLCVAHQLQRNSIGIEIDPQNSQCIDNRLRSIKESDLIQKYFNDYYYTENLRGIWGEEFDTSEILQVTQSLNLFNN